MDLASHPALMVLSIVVASSLLAEINLGLKIPIVVWEILFGMILGPGVLALARNTNGELWSWFGTAGLAALLFMAGMEIDFRRVRGRPLTLAVAGWGLSLGLALVCGVLLSRMRVVDAPMLVALAVATTALGTILPILRDSGTLDTSLGTHVLAAGSIGEFAPVLAVSLLLTRKFDAWLQISVLLAFTVVAVGCAFVALRLRTPRILNILDRGMRSSSQLPVCVALLILGLFAFLAEKIGFEAVVGAFSAGMVIGLATSGKSENEKLFREKMEAICFAVFIPFFFVLSGINLDVQALLHSWRAMILLPVFMAIFVVVRGAPVVIYGGTLEARERLPFVLYSATQLPMVVAIVAIGVRTKIMQPEIAAALIGAGLLSVLLFPALANATISTQTESNRRLATAD